MDLASIEKNKNRVWFVEDMVAQQIFPDVHNWLRENTQQVANLDVHIQARNFKMRVYLYDPVKNSPNPNKLEPKSSNFGRKFLPIELH